MELETSFGRWLRQRRRALDLTQDDLARQVGCSVFTVRKIEADERRPSRQLAERLADKLMVASGDRAAIISLARAEPYLNPRAAEAPEQPLPAPQQPLGNLPVPLTRLIGRKQDLAAVRNMLLHSETRLLMLLGPPGVGKTRLSIAVAHEVQAAFGDGAYFVELAPLGDTALVLVTIAQALGIREIAGQLLLETLKIALHSKRLLLVLDNFEHILDAAPPIVELLEACVGLKALITSRAALHVRGERLYALPPLLLPDPTRLPATGVLARIPAMALFVERAQAALPHFRLTDQNAAAVAALCVRLDGLPLAIELAAARIKLFAPEELLARLERRLALLTGGPRDLPQRQQTLRNTIAWSYQLLDRAQQTLFTRLAVFVGGWILEAAEAVCNPADELGIAIVDGLQSLLDQSLLRQVEGLDGVPRFRRLETIREYALERLAESGEAAVSQRRHADYFLRLAERAEPELRGIEQTTWLARLEVEYDNLRAALGWAVQRGEVELGARLAGALWRFWEARGLWSEGAAHLAEIAPKTLVDALPHTGVWAKLLQGRAVLAFYLGDHAAARLLFEHSLARFRELEDRSGIAWTLIYYGWQINDGGDPLGARPLFEESLTIFRELGDRQGMGWALARLGLVYLFLGELPAAYPLLEEGLALCRAVGDRWGTAWILQLLGVVVGELGDPAAAVALEAESLAISRALGDRRNMGYAQAILAAYQTLDRGEYAEAQPLIAEALRGQHEIGDQWGMALVLWVAAVVSAAHGQPTRAVCLESASAALVEAIGAALPLAASPTFTQILQVSHQALSKDEQQRAWTEGRAMTLEQAIAYAVGEDGLHAQI
jgi:predicted ATPase/transcriptional regulator with XRE-family HTH domain